MKIVVTGGSRGIGRMIVESLYKDNEVILISQSKESVGRARTALKNRIQGYVANVSDYRKAKDVFERIGPFDALINCAGVLGPVGSLKDNDIESWERTIKINLMGTVNCCKAAIPILSKKKRAKIINISGGGSAFPRVYHSAYATSKAAVVRFTETLAKDFANDRIPIDVNVIAPGAHKTDLWGGEKFDKEPEKWDDPKLLEKLVKFLLSEGSDGISGKFLSIKDDYEKLDKNINDTDLFTLRRIDNFKFKKID